MARVLWLGDAGCTTGFGTVSHAIGDRLVDVYGHDVHTLATNYRGDHWPTSMKLYVPTLRDQRDVYGVTRFVEMLGKVGPEVVISLNDPLVLLRHLFKNSHDKVLSLARYAPILAYFPVDGLNYPGVVSRIPDLVSALEPLEGARTPKPFLLPIVMSKFGNTTFPNAPLVYHGIDTETFRPVTMRPTTMSNGAIIKSKADAKRALELPDDCILAVRVDRNSQRKNYADSVKALVPVMQKEPKLHVWFHAKAEDSVGIDFNLLVSRFPDVQDRFHWPGMFDTTIGWNLEDLVTVYNAGDFFLSTSGGEGFGLTLGEALACELPVIAMNVSAIPEVVGPGGVLLEPDRTYVPLSGQDNWLPNVEAFTGAIRKMVSSKGARRDLGKAGRKHVVESFSWDEAANRFDQLITSVVQKASGDATPGGAS